MQKNHGVWRFLRLGLLSVLSCPALLSFAAVAAAGTMPNIQYSEKYFDMDFEYRHVVLPAEVARLCPKNKLLSENEWRNLGVQQSRGWVHYAIHRPEPHILLFRRPLGTDPATGKSKGQSAAAPDLRAPNEIP
jgi:cyclin-dependent kinase regulatory subunit CKS1